MANDHDVNVDIVAKDDASAVLEDVATKAEDVEQTSPTVTVDADTSAATSDLEGVKSAAAEVDGLTPQVVMETNLAAFHEQVQKAIAEAKGLDGTHVDLDTSGAVTALHKVRDAGDQAQGKVKKLGGEESVQAISDLTGPLGDISGNVSNVGQSFTGLATTIGASMGLSEASVESLGALLAPAGIVGGIVFTFWQSWKKKAEEARQATIDTVKSIEDIGATATAQKNLLDKLHKDPGFAQAAADLHISLQDMVDFINGKSVPAVEDLQGSLSDYAKVMAAVGTRAFPDFVSAAQAVLGVTKDQARALEDEHGATKKVNDIVSTQTGLLHGAQSAYSDLHSVVTGKFNPALDATHGKAKDVNTELGKIEGDHKGSVTVTTNDKAVDGTTGKLDALDGRVVTTTVNVNTNAAAVLGQFRSLFGLASGGGSASRGAATVADIRAYERVNGRGWRTP